MRSKSGHRCIFCGRDGITISAKGYVKRHLTPSGISCHFAGIPERLIKQYRANDADRAIAASKIGRKPNANRKQPSRP